MEQELFTGYMLLLMFLFGVMVFLLGMVSYILMAIGFYKIATREGKKDLAWLAWIPIGNIFLLLVLVEGAVYKDFKGNLTLFYGILLVAAAVAGTFFSLAPLIPGVFANILMFYAFYYVANRYSPNALLHLIIAIITLGLSMGVQFFLFRNKDVVDSIGLKLASNEDEDAFEVQY